MVTLCDGGATGFTSPDKILPMMHQRVRWSVLSKRHVAMWAAAAIVCFFLAYEIPALSWMIAAYVFALVQITRAANAKAALLAGLAVGFCAFAGELTFLFGLFGPFSVFLWLVGAFWIASFCWLGRALLVRYGDKAAMALLPCLWIALEYTRSELYWLRFSWLIPGYVFAGHGQPLPIRFVGVYGVGFLLTFVATVFWRLDGRRPFVAGAVGLVSLACAVYYVGGERGVADAVAGAVAGNAESEGPLIAGVQMEFPDPWQVIAALDDVVEHWPDADIIVLSEYTLDGPPPDAVRSWCRRNERYLVVGGKSPVGGDADDFYNTAFVVGPSGDVVFEQAKSVPIQFFRDGRPAPAQSVWESPWGKIGICICYDMSFSRVTDELIRQGAQLLVVPTMDVTQWGRRQHELHAMVAPSRAAEYGVPIVRVCSSGVSQIVDDSGHVRASLPYPGQGEMFARRVRFATTASVPPDRYLAWVAIAIVAAALVALPLPWRWTGAAAPEG